jgi:hypothetical protein
LETRFYLDPATGLPHIYNHNVDEVEVIEVLEKPGEDRAGSEAPELHWTDGCGSISSVIYVPDPQPDSVFVITAYELAGKGWRHFAPFEHRWAMENALTPEVTVC